MIAPARVALTSNDRLILFGLVALGVVLTGLGISLEPARTWASWLLVGQFAIGLGLAGLCFVSIHYASGASWSVAVRRVPEAMAGTIPYSSLLLGLVFVGWPRLYSWTGASFLAEGGESSWFKHWWLSWPFFLGRAAAYCIVWTLFATAIRRASRRQDADGAARWTHANARLSVAFLVIFGVTFTLASVDWIMSLEAEWYSTIFGVYAFAGLFSSGLAAIIAGVLWLERRGPLQRVVTDEHLHDLGKLLFAFSCFWMYIWLSQYLLIWYTNIPEEASYFTRRTHGVWFVLFVANVVFNWIVPFAALLRRDAKRHRRTLAWVTGIVLLGRWVDLYLMIFPSVVGEAPRLGLWEFGVTCGGIGAFGLILVRIMAGAPAVPVADPQLPESLQYEQ